DVEAGLHERQARELARQAVADEDRFHAIEVALLLRDAAPEALAQAGLRADALGRRQVLVGVPHVAEERRDLPLLVRQLRRVGIRTERVQAQKRRADALL